MLVDQPAGKRNRRFVGATMRVEPVIVAVRLQLPGRFDVAVAMAVALNKIVIMVIHCYTSNTT